MIGGQLCAYHVLPTSFKLKAKRQPPLGIQANLAWPLFYQRSFLLGDTY